MIKVKFVGYNYRVLCLQSVVYPGILFGGGGEDVQQIQLRTEDGENGDLGAVDP